VGFYSLKAVSAMFLNAKSSFAGLGPSAGIVPNLSTLTGFLPINVIGFLRICFSGYGFNRLKSV